MKIKNFSIFRLWLAKVGYERIEEIKDPELAFDRAIISHCYAELVSASETGALWLDPEMNSG